MLFDLIVKFGILIFIMATTLTICSARVESNKFDNELLYAKTVFADKRINCENIKQIKFDELVSNLKDEYSIKYNFLRSLSCIDNKIHILYQSSFHSNLNEFIQNLNHHKKRESLQYTVIYFDKNMKKIKYHECLSSNKKCSVMLSQKDPES